MPRKNALHTSITDTVDKPLQVRSNESRPVCAARNGALVRMSERKEALTLGLTMIGGEIASETGDCSYVCRLKHEH